MSASPQIVTVIPARGGSKSIPMKNIQPLHGKPLLQYSIEYSKTCKLVGRTIVSTDSEVIAKIAVQCGAEVPFMRPSDLAQDNTQDFPVLRHALSELEKQQGISIDLLVLLRPTSPLRPPSLIEAAVRLLNEHPDATSVRSVAPSKEHPYRQWSVRGPFMYGYEQNVPEPYNLPRQQLPPLYFQTGDIEVIRRQTLLDGSISGDRVLPLIIQHELVFDIDTPQDWRRAEDTFEIGRKP